MHNHFILPPSRERNPMQRWSLWKSGALLIAVLAALVVIDLVSEATRFRDFQWFVLIASAIACMLAWLRRRGYWPLALWPAFAAAFMGLAYWDHSPSKPFARFHRSIQIGMTRDEVQSRLEAHCDWRGRHTGPEPFKVHPDQVGWSIHPPGWIDEMVVNIYFTDGRVSYCSLHDD